MGGFVLVSGNFRTKTSSFCGSQLAGDTGLRHAGRQAWDQHVAEGAGCYRSQAGGLPQTDKGSFPSVKASCSGQGLKQHEEMTESAQHCTARVAPGGESHGQNPFNLAQDQGPLGKAVET